MASNLRIGPLRRYGWALLAVAVMTGCAPASSGSAKESGTVPGGRFIFEVPWNWNGTVLLSAQGSAFEANNNDPTAGPDSALTSWLLDRGIALIGLSYTGAGWLLADAPKVTTEALDRFGRLHGKPTVALIWGGSINGMVAGALAEQLPERFAGALLYCPAIDDMTAFLQTEFDGAFAFARLLAATAGLRLTDGGAIKANISAVDRAASAAQSSPAGRARMALVSALMNFSGWVAPQPTEPADPEQMERGQATALAGTIDGFFYLRAHLADAAHGNPVGNERTDYGQLLNHSHFRSEVLALYQRANLDLNADLSTLATATRIKADTAAAEYLADHPHFTGQLRVPVLALESTGDDWLVNAVLDYRARVIAANRSSEFREAWVTRPGHCPFSRIELATALDVLLERVKTAHWPSTTQGDLATRAQVLENQFPGLRAPDPAERFTSAP
jgi:pimeloyl-ACP methyl ester carboxylesterase